MASSSPRRRSSALLLVATAAAFGACGSDQTARFDPASDDAAIATIASAWAEGGGIALSLCEDTARSAAWTGPDGCQVDHVVRGGGLGRAHTETHDTGGCGMGGCPYSNVAYVVGTLSGTGAAGELSVGGRVGLDANGAGGPYAYPYALELTCTDPATPCAVSGTLRADGSVSAVVYVGAVETRHELTRVGPATCP